MYIGGCTVLCWFRPPVADPDNWQDVTCRQSGGSSVGRGIAVDWAGVRHEDSGAAGRSPVPGSVLKTIGVSIVS